MASFFRFLFMIIWSALLITISVFLMVVLFNRKIPLIMARTMWGPGILWAAGAKVKESGAANIDQNVSYIFASNHLSYLDIPALFKAIPVNLYFIAKKEIMWMPFIGFFMWATGMIFLDRKNKERAIASLDRAGSLIKNGKNVLVFPEGTRSRDGQVGQMKKGTFKLAAKAGLPIVPVAVIGTDKIMPANSFRITPGEVTLVIGSPLYAKEGESLDAFMNRVREVLIELKA